MAVTRAGRFRIVASAEQIATPSLRCLLQQWLQACPPGSMPAEEFIDPFQLRYILGWLMVVDAVAQPAGGYRFRYRLVGTNLVDRRGCDNTGRWVDENPDAEMAELAVASSHAAISNRQPIQVECERAIDGRFYPIEILVLPLADAEGRPKRLLVGQIYPEDAPVQPYRFRGAPF